MGHLSALSTTKYNNYGLSSWMQHLLWFAPLKPWVRWCWRERNIFGLQLLVLFKRNEIHFLWHEFYRHLSHVIRSYYSTNVHLLRTLLFWTLLIHIFFCCWKWWSVHSSTNNQLFSYLYYNNFPFSYVCSSSLFNGISISSETSRNAKGLTDTIVLSLSSVPLLRGSCNLIK